jgi:hypothetical protein
MTRGPAAATLAVTMETMHAPGRRKLPPVPRTGTGTGTGTERARRRAAQTVIPADATTTGTVPARLDAAAADDEAVTERFTLDPATVERDIPVPASADGADTDAVAADAADLPDSPPLSESELDAAQQFVARLRSAAADFAAAAGAASAVVREAVPPARHRRARCRVVLQYADGAETDVTFLGSAGAPGTPSRHGFDRQIQRWLGGGQHREDGWLVPDPDAPDGVAIDVTAWIAAA